MDELTLDDWKMYLAYWRKHPPTDALVAAYLGYGKDKTSPEAHKESLDQRWAAGALNAKQLFEMSQGSGGGFGLRH